jgi:hypothetical protein
MLRGRSLFAPAAGLALAGLGYLLLVPGQAAVAAGQAGTLSISPAIIDTVAGEAGELPSITVANGTRVRFRIRIYPALVDQMLDGGLTIRERRPQLQAAARRFALSPRALILGPGETATVRARLLQPSPAGEAVGAAVVEAVPAVPDRRAPLYRLRLLGALLVPGVRAPAPRGRIESVRVVQAGPRHLRFAVRVRNTGKVHGYPSALHLRIRDRSGRTVFSTAPRTGVVLPSYARNLPVELFKRLPAGRYVAEASGLFGSVRSRTLVGFTLAGPNRLPAP